MKKRIAVFANGWGNQYLRETVTGLYEVAKEADTDIFTFVDFSSFAETQKEINNSEYNIFRLPDLRDFDGVVIMANSFNMPEETEFVYRIVMESHLPAISLEYDYPGITTIHTDNYHGMHELAEHVIEQHGVRHIVFIGGPKEHPESNIRLKAVSDVAAEHGLSLRDEDIMYGDWAKNLCKSLVKGWINSHDKKLPDIFICANDVMAASTCDALTEYGFKVPDDVLVTGYDCIKQGREYEPPIASVSHEWMHMGSEAMRLLLAKMAGQTTEDHLTMKTRFVPGGSCGCELKEDDIGRLHGYLTQEIDGLLCDSHFRHFYNATKKVETEEDLNRALDRLFQGECWMEGGNFMFCIDPEFFSIDENTDNLMIEGYCKNVDVVCSLRDGVAMPMRTLGIKEAMFSASSEISDPRIYIFVPIYSEERSYGFAMMERNLDIVEDNYLYIWTRHFNQCMDHVRRNVTIAALTRKLTLLSVTDVLTGVYNRAGCEKIAYPMLMEWHKTGGTGALMIADIDKMKTINDKFGHASGDIALRTVASVLKDQLPKDWIICRFGGDEFFVGGKLLDGMDLEEMKDAITLKLASEVKRMQVPFKLTISIGYARIDPDGSIDLESQLRLADQFMYIVKEQHHQLLESQQ